MMDCPTLVNLPYGEFSERLHAKVVRERIPISGSIELTARCNMRCVHCYLPMTQRAGSQDTELSTEEIGHIFTEIADAGCLWLLLTGGEPLLRRDFLNIYDDAKRKGFIITLFTNGTLVNEQIADHLAQFRPFEIEISLYGATQETYEHVTGIPGSFARCMRGIDLLLERNLPVRLKSVVLTLNHHELNQMKELCERLGVGFRFDPVITAGIDGDQHPVEYRLSPEQIVGIEQKDDGRAKAWPRAFEEAKAANIASRQMFTCGAGWSSFHIDAMGRLSLCLSVRNPNYDLMQGSFTEGWEKFLSGLRTLETSPSFECAGCSLRPVCAQCPAMGWSEHGDPEAKVIFLCKLAHQRQSVFGQSAISQGNH